MNTAEDAAERPPTFEQARARLEQIVGQLEDGQIGLADSLALYEEGVRLLKQCYGLLERAERKIELLTGVDAQGNPLTESLAEAEFESLQEKGASRSRRRSRAPRKGQQGNEAAEPAADGGDVDETGALF